jgi:hypothetical protein
MLCRVNQTRLLISKTVCVVVSKKLFILFTIIFGCFEGFDTFGIE